VSSLYVALSNITTSSRDVNLVFDSKFQNLNSHSLIYAIPLSNLTFSSIQIHKLHRHPETSLLMDGPSAGHPSTTPTHYQVLGLSPTLLKDTTTAASSSLIKKAYHRALLQNHPDKKASATFEPQKTFPSSSSSSSSSSPQIYTVDQISQAFNVLSSAQSRAEYDAALRLARAATGAGGGGGGGGDDAAITRFQTGIENVDLDDLEFDEQDGKWYRSCRCGNDRGYTFKEADLEEASDDGVLIVGCHDCSLWLRVHFAVVDDL
jgi:hypothetical protein